ncbi:MAG TPA: energy transducer TonB [Sphingomicrobium sp.]|nr:energy transducer TonB [Sphingomicrobium sp.]
MKAPKFMAAVAAVVFLEASVQAQQPPVLQPIKPWVVHFDDTECYAERTYGTSANPAILGIRPSPSGDTYELLLAHKQPAPRYAQQLEGSVDFGHAPMKAWLLRYAIKDAPYRIDKFRIEASAMAAARSAASVGFHIAKAAEERLALASMAGVLATLEKCNEGLRVYWNMTDAGQKQIAKPARGDVRQVFTDKDYPDEASTQEGQAQFLLFIDEKGAIAACHVLKPSGIPAMDGMGCQVILQRARFKPATDASGKPLRSAVVTPPVVWRLYGP